MNEGIRPDDGGDTAAPDTNPQHHAWLDYAPIAVALVALVATALGLNLAARWPWLVSVAAGVTAYFAIWAAGYWLLVWRDSRQESR